MKFIIILALFISLNCFASTKFILNQSITDCTQMKFEIHIGESESFNNALALNIEYDQIKKIRSIIEKRRGKSLKFFTSWKKEGEAHVTTISPLEYKYALKNYISMKRINEIAVEQKI